MDTGPVLTVVGATSALAVVAAVLPLKPVLPEPSFIYHKDFHFLDEPLIERQKKREAAVAAKVAA